MRVLLLNTSFRAEGPNNTFREIAARAREHAVDIWAGALEGRGAMEGVYRSLGVPTVYFGRPGPGRYTVAGRVQRFIREHGIDLLHSQLLRGEVVGRLALRSIPGLPYVCTIQNEDPYRIPWKNPLKAALSRWALRKADAVVLVSRNLQDFVQRYQGIHPGITTVIPNSIDGRLYKTKDSFPPPADFPQDSLIIGTVGRISPQKGQRYLIDAFHRMVRKFPRARLMIIGSGPLAKRMRKLAERGSGARRIRFVGWKSRVDRFLPFFSIYVQPSLWEGMPFATLEAMASGVSVIASRVGGLEELISDGHDGILVPPKDVDALENAMIRLAEDENYRMRLSRKARHKIHSDYRADIMAREYYQLYHRLIHHGNRTTNVMD